MKEFEEIEDILILDRQKRVERDIEMIIIKWLSDSKFRDIKCILKENTEVFMSKHHNNLKTGVIKKNKKLYIVLNSCKEELDRGVQELLELNLI